MANRVYGYQGYKGYQFETSPKKVQPEYEPEVTVQKKENMQQNKNRVKKQSNKTINQAKKISKEELNKKAKLVCYIVFGFTVLFTISYRNSIINEKFSGKENLKAELAEVQKINEQLEVGIENELNLTGVEQLAKEKLGMGKLNNSQKVYVSLPKKEYVESKSESLVSNTEKSSTSVIEGIKHLLNIK